MLTKSFFVAPLPVFHTMWDSNPAQFTFLSCTRLEEQPSYDAYSQASVFILVGGFIFRFNRVTAGHTEMRLGLGIPSFLNS